MNMQLCETTQLRQTNQKTKQARKHKPGKILGDIATSLTFFVDLILFFEFMQLWFLLVSKYDFLLITWGFKHTST